MLELVNMKYLVKFQEQNCLDADGVLGKNTLKKMIEVFKIPNINHMAHFLGQVAHESGMFRFGIENLNYSKAALVNVFGKYFNEETAKDYSRCPERIANRVYANRMGNGPEDSGDGWKYRGAGAIQLTGKNNHKAFERFIGNDCAGNAELIAEEYYFETALWFFKENNLWSLCENVTDLDINRLTKRINGGYNGLDHRKELTHKYLTLLKSI